MSSPLFSAQQVGGYVFGAVTRVGDTVNFVTVRKLVWLSATNCAICDQSISRKAHSFRMTEDDQGFDAGLACRLFNSGKRQAITKDRSEPISGSV